MRIYLKKSLGIVIVLFIFTGCVTHPKPFAWGENSKSRRGGVMHTVQKGQTLWKIAQTYGIPIRKIRAANRLKSNNQIQAGQKLWIPGARKVLFVPPTCPSQVPPVKFFWPLQGTIIRKFGHIGLQRSEGIDIRAPLGASIRSAAAGRVIYAGSDLKGYGKVIIIQHPGGYSTVYANNKENLVGVHGEVRSGQVIGRVGQAEESHIPYLHFEIRCQDKALDPISFLP